MNQKTLNKLEFPKIVEMLLSHASSFGGKQQCKHLKPMTDINKINTAQEETAAAFTRIVKKAAFLLVDVHLLATPLSV